MALPWLWPMVQHRFQSPLRFGAYFLLPPESLRRQLRPSIDDWLLKLLRSLLILLLILLLAHPFWREQRQVQDVWVLDDTASLPEGVSLPLQASTSGQAIRLSDLLAAEAPTPAESLPGTPSGHPGSPSLSEIAEAVLQPTEGEQAVEFRIFRRASTSIILRPSSPFAGTCSVRRPHNAATPPCRSCVWKPEASSSRSSTSVSLETQPVPEAWCCDKTATSWPVRSFQTWRR